jgi:hypothetical protein
VEEVGPELLRSVSRVLKIDATAASVLTALEAASVPAILLKGSTLDFLHAGRRPRSYVDVDVLVPFDRVSDAESVLAGLGYRNALEGFRPDEGSDHGEHWIRPGAPAVDLHHKLGGSTAPSPVVWEVLSRRTRPHQVAGTDVSALDEAGCALHVALHSATPGNSAVDLDRAVAVLPEETWRDAIDLAAAIGADDAFRAGLRATASGAQCAERLGVPEPDRLAWRLERFAPTGSRSLAQILELPGFGARVRAAARKIHPSAAQMRFDSSLARRGRWGLLLARAIRPFLLVARLAPAVRALWSARRRRR